MPARKHKYCHCPRYRPQQLFVHPPSAYQSNMPLLCSSLSFQRKQLPRDVLGSSGVSPWGFRSPGLRACPAPHLPGAHTQLSSHSPPQRSAAVLSQHPPPPPLRTMLQLQGPQKSPPGQLDRGNDKQHTWRQPRGPDEETEQGAMHPSSGDCTQAPPPTDPQRVSWHPGPRVRTNHPCCVHLRVVDDSKTARPRAKCQHRETP